jgi:hypothetical protein
MILNTFDMLEPQAIKAITEGACVPKGSTPPLYCIGPRIVDAKQRGASDDALSKCLLWLDKQPSQSVVFLCFGRKGAFSAPQLKEISFGLERYKLLIVYVHIYIYGLSFVFFSIVFDQIGANKDLCGW